MSESTLKLRSFNLDKIEPGAVVITVGKRHSGKGWIIRDLMHTLYLRGMPYGAIYSGTEHCSPFFKDFFPDTYIFRDTDCTDEALGRLFEQQDKKCREWVTKVQECDCLHCRQNPYQFDLKRGHCIHNNMLLVTDDMQHLDKLLRKSPNFSKIFLQGRHSNVLFITALQFSLGLPPVLRSNIDYVFLYAEDEISNLKRLYENYAGIIPSFQMFRDILDQCTENYGCLVIDKRSKSRKLTDRIFYYKAKDPGPFKFGSKRFWQKHYENQKLLKEPRIILHRDEDHHKRSSTLVKRKIFDTVGQSGKKYTIIMNTED